MAAISLPIAIMLGLGASGGLQAFLQYLTGESQIKAAGKGRESQARASALITDKLAAQKTEMFEQMRALKGEERERGLEQTMMAMMMQPGLQSGQMGRAAMMNWHNAASAVQGGGGILELVRSLP